VISHPIIDRLKKLPSYSPTHRILYVPILVDPDEWMPLGQVADTPRGDSPYVLWCGNLSEATKDIEFLIRVMKTVNDVEMCRLLLVGNHNESVRSSIYNLAGNIGLKERSLCLTGFVSDDELRKLMNGAEALLMPLWETERSVCRFPTKLGLYLSSATPVVATAIGELTRYLEDVKSAYLAPPNTINGFAERIIALIRDPKRAKSIGLAGQQVARRHFSIQAHQDQLVEFFSDLARNNGKCRG
jgi:glycosyltransferase involved in cell wall biosynthesis